MFYEAYKNKFNKIAYLIILICKSKSMQFKNDLYVLYYLFNQKQWLKKD